ncbi:DNA-binding protein WhiA [Anaerotignum sp.]|nr:DNA-binding protein WhiA [Anaerotignum sp.]MBQ7757538.1 DNA-binding protein WhiA [Anaerotignum sp.]
MSFSSKVKGELSLHFGNGRHCEIAETAAFVNICGQTAAFDGDFCLKIQTENLHVVKKCFTLLQNTFNIIADVSVRTSGQKHQYTLLVRDPAQTETLLRATGMLFAEEGKKKLVKRIYPPVVGSICCRRAYIRGAFLSVGSVSDPEKNYHLEFVLADMTSAEQLRDLVNAFGLDAKVVERKEHFVVYLKEGEQIVDLLNVMEAPLALMDLENVRIVKEMRNDINRKVNCETANLNKVVGAAVKQLEDINYIEATIGLNSLPEQLAEVARLRLEYPDKSLKELGSFLMTPVGKSGVNHRLRKISNIAEALREGKGEVE